MRFYSTLPSIRGEKYKFLPYRESNPGELNIMQYPCQFAIYDGKASSSRSYMYFDLILIFDSLQSRILSVLI